MSIIQWRTSHELGFKEIDEQHHHLINILNKLFESYNDDAEEEVLGDVLSELEEYIKIHFETEERYFRKFNYQGADVHIAAHRAFEKEVEQLRKEFDQKGPDVINKVTDLIGRWFVDHEANFDGDYVECFKENGLT